MQPAPPSLTHTCAASSLKASGVPTPASFTVSCSCLVVSAVSWAAGVSAREACCVISALSSCSSFASLPNACKHRGAAAPVSARAPAQHQNHLHVGGGCS